MVRHVVNALFDNHVLDLDVIDRVGLAIHTLEYQLKAVVAYIVQTGNQRWQTVCLHHLRNHDWRREVPIEVHGGPFTTAGVDPSLFDGRKIGWRGDGDGDRARKRISGAVGDGVSDGILADKSRVGSVSPGSIFVIDKAAVARSRKLTQGKRSVIAKVVDGRIAKGDRPILFENKIFADNLNHVPRWQFVDGRLGRRGKIQLPEFQERAHVPARFVADLD